MRSHYCGHVNRAEIGRTIKVAGWVHRRRDHGGVIFIDLRDREGLLQVVFDPDRAEMFAEAERLRSEYVLAVEGRVRARPRGHGESEPRERRGRAARDEAHGAREVEDAAVPSRRARQRGAAAALSLSRSAPRADAEELAVASRRHARAAQVHGRARLRRRRDADLDEDDARGRARLSRAEPHAARQLLRAAAVAAAHEAAADDVGARSLLSDRQVLPRRGSARGPAARVHAARYRDEVHDRGGHHRAHGAAAARDVQVRARRRAAEAVPAHDLRRRDAPLRQRQARSCATRSSSSRSRISSAASSSRCSRARPRIRRAASRR